MTNYSLLISNFYIPRATYHLIEFVPINNSTYKPDNNTPSFEQVSTIYFFHIQFLPSIYVMVKSPYNTNLHLKTQATKKC